MNWYQGKDSPQSVNEVVVEVKSPKAVESKFGMMMLGSKYQMLRTNEWVTGYFRMDGDEGPYLLVRADGYVDKLKGQPFRIAHCFYKMKAGGLFAIFIDFPGLKGPGGPSNPFPFILFEMIRGIDMDDERARIFDAINRPNIHLCFAEGDGIGEEANGMWSGSPINAAFDVVVDINEDCRNALNKQWESLLEYHGSLSTGARNFNDTVQQMQIENPVSRNPIIKKNKSTGKKKEKVVKADSSSVTTKDMKIKPDPVLKTKKKSGMAAKNKIATWFGYAGGALFFGLNIITEGVVPGGFLGGVIGFVVGFGLAWAVLAFIPDKK